MNKTLFSTALLLSCIASGTTFVIGDEPFEPEFENECLSGNAEP